MKLFNDLFIVGKSLFIKNKKMLVLSDLHIGQDSAMNNQGFLVPRFQYDDLFNETQVLIKQTKPEIVVLNGDIKHEFSGISREEWTRIKEYISFLKRKCEVIIIKGNHDSIIKPLANSLDVSIKDYLLVGDFFICHGDKLFNNEDFKKSKVVIIGHEHPAVSLRNGVRVEKFKCFLKGSFENKILIVIPAMNPSSEGSDILKEKLLSPFLKNNAFIKKFEALIVEENKIYSFGKLKDIEKFS